jgi:hypothetical protein
MRSKILIALIFSSVITGCSTYSANRYSISVDNVTALKRINGTKVNVGGFTATNPGKSEIMCRGVGPIKTPDGQTFENFIKKALVDELKMAESFSTSAPITLTGNLDSIDFSSNSGNWILALTISSSNGKSVSVSENYSYTTSFYGETACNQTAQALMPAVQNVIAKVVQNSEFLKLIEDI